MTRNERLAEAHRQSVVDGIVITLITGILLFAIITLYGEAILDFLKNAIGG